MIQRTFKIHSRKELLALIDKIKSSREYAASKCVLIKGLTTQFIKENVMEAHKLFVNALPKAKVVGLSLTTFGREIISKHPESVLSHVVVTFLFFFKSEVTVLECGGDQLEYIDPAIILKDKLLRIPNVKGVEIFCAGKSRYMASFLETLTEGFENVPFFGAEAGIINLEKTTCQYHRIISSVDGKNVVQYIMGDKYYDNGFVLLVYSGEELEVQVEALLGWKPLGKEMKITQTIGSTCIATIDDIPAARIYEKYLNVKPDKYMLMNICEFPLIINRHGFDFARVPPIYDEQGRLYFGADVYEGEKIQLSYGNLQDILKETWLASERLRQFKPEMVSLIICGARNIFLKDSAEIEISYFKRFHPELVFCHGSSEIYRRGGKGGVLNSSMVAIGMREGARVYDDLETVEETMPPDDTPKIIPLADRLANFLEATTDELKSTNYILKKIALEAESANRAKSQFLSSMSHELRTPINAILGMNEMILRECKDEPILEYAENIRNAGNSLLSLVNDILDFSKIESGKMEIIPVEYALSSLLNDLVNMVQKRAEKKSSSMPHRLCRRFCTATKFASNRRQRTFSPTPSSTPKKVRSL